MLKIYPIQTIPPVDNELQNSIPNLLQNILALIWSERMGWFFGMDMGICYDPNEPAIVEAQQRAKQLEARLRSLGIDPNSL